MPFRLSILAAAICLFAAPAPLAGQEPPSESAPEPPEERGGGATGAELTTLRTAMEIAFLDTGAFHTIENLDDLAPGSTPVHDFDDIDNGGSGTPVLLESTGRFSPARRSLGNFWHGPYVSYQQGRIELDPPFVYDEGTLLDFFGEPYRLYSALGLVNPQTESVTLDEVGDRYDRWTLLSAGPDLQLATADDVIRQFGGAPTSTVISGAIALDGPLDARGGPIYATSETVGPILSGQAILIRGYNFGAAQGSSRVLLDGFDLGPAISWGGTQIQIEIPEPRVGSLLELEINGNVRDSLSVQVLLSAEGWQLFE